MFKRKVSLISGFVLAMAGPVPAVAQWPERPVTLVAPMTPGGNIDTLARLVAKSLSERLGQPVVVENRPGAGGKIGSQYVMRAKPDGYTLLLGSVANVLYKHFHKDVSADFTYALQPVSQLVSVPNFLVVAKNSHINGVGDLIKEAKSNPSGVSCGNPGVGTTPWLTCELLKSRLEINIANISYKGSAPALADVIGGQITFAVASEALPYIKDNRLKGIAVSSMQPSPLAPDIEPLSKNIKEIDVVSWFGIFAPKGTPQHIVDRLGQEIVASLASKEMHASLAALGASPVGSTPVEFEKYYRSQAIRWEQEISTMNIQPQ